MDIDQQRRTARTMWHLLEPIHAVTYFSDETTAAYKAVGLKGFWQGYFASRVAPMGPVGGEVCAAVFYNFQPEMVQRALPSAWAAASPETVLAARDEALQPVLASMFGDADSVAEAADLATLAIEGCALEGRALFAGHAALPPPDDAILRLWWAATLLREHRGDGHIAALMVDGIGGLESHVLASLDMGLPAASFGRIHHLPAAQLDIVIGGLRDRGLVGDDGWLSATGQAVKRRVESLTDDLAAPPYECLAADELEALEATLEPLATRLVSAQDW